MERCYGNFNPYCTTMTSFGTLLARALFLQFAFNEILNLVHFLLLLIQEVHDDAHGGLLQPNTLNLVLQSVLHVAQSQRGMDQNYYRKKTTASYLYFFKCENKNIHFSGTNLMEYILWSTSQKIRKQNVILLQLRL